MRVVHLCASDRDGAGRAAYRLHRGLRGLGIDSTLLVHERTTDDPHVLLVPSPGQFEATPVSVSLEAIQAIYIDARRSALSNTLFSFPYPGLDLSLHPAIQSADVIHLHWIARSLSPVTLQTLLAAGKPVVWTLHDHWPFTGGCHYSAGCTGYERDCADCPQLTSDPVSLPSAVLMDKLVLLADGSLCLVAPSAWMARCARASRLFHGRRIETIANGCDTQQYRPRERAATRALLGLNPGKVYLLFGVVDAAEHRKGFHLLQRAIEVALGNPDFAAKVAEGNVAVLTFGKGNEALRSPGVPVHALGYLTDEDQIAAVYAAADLFVLPSIEDNLPNTVVEALCCGTPVIAFGAGGLPEMIDHGENGLVIEPGDDRAMGAAIVALVLDSDRRDALGTAGRERAVERYDQTRQAAMCVSLYDELVTDQHGTADGHTTRAEPTRNETLGPAIRAVFEAAVQQCLPLYAVNQSRHLALVEADRVARLRVIETLSAQLAESEADRAARLRVIEMLSAQLAESEADRAARLQAIQQLEAWLKTSEADRAARLVVIEQLQAQLQQCQAEREMLRQEVQRLEVQRRADVRK